MLRTADMAMIPPPQSHRFSYNEPMPVESCTQSLCDLALRFGALHASLHVVMLLYAYLCAVIYSCSSLTWLNFLLSFYLWFNEIKTP